jgi:hypothetical protein
MEEKLTNKQNSKQQVSDSTSLINPQLLDNNSSEKIIDLNWAENNTPQISSDTRYFELEFLCATAGIPTPLNLRSWKHGLNKAIVRS